MIPDWEKLLQTKILPELEEGRPDFDMPHTKAVVIKIKEIMKDNPDLDIDPEVLIIAAYAHDWGYSNLFKKGEPAQIDTIMDAKEAHMQIGAKKIAKLLDNPAFSFLSDGRKARIIHLVSVHDRLNQIKDLDEILLMEADTLGAADLSLVKTGFNKESNDKWTAGAKNKRIPKFITDYSKRQIERILKERELYFKDKG